MIQQCAIAYANLYTSLAEAFSDPPAWLAGAGQDWPLFNDAMEVAALEDDSEIARLAYILADIPEESLEKRRFRYDSLFSGGTAGIRLYESLWRDGRLVGDSTFAIWRMYEIAGVAVAGSELPDHVSMELAFLAYLAGQEADDESDSHQWRKVRRLFIKNHAGQWFPALGNAVVKTQDPVYAPLGQMLSYIVGKKTRARRRPAGDERALPAITELEQCTLCGICTGVCPTCALRIHENQELTSLILIDTDCNGCNRCTRICPTGALSLESSLLSNSARLLRESARVRCPCCGEPTVSQAEYSAIAAQLGEPEWLKFCNTCRPLLMEKMR